MKMPDAVCRTQKIDKSFFEHGRVQAGADDIGERNAEPLEHFRGCEDSALGVAQPFSVGQRRLIAGSPQQYRFADLARGERNGIFRPEITMRNEQTVHFFFRKMRNGFFRIVDPAEQSFLVDAFQICNVTFRSQ